MMDQTSLVFYKMLDRYFSGQKGTHDYEINDVSVSNKLNFIELVFKFKNGASYCCPELTCHFNPNWDKIRELAAKEDVALSKPLKIRFHVTVESGASFTANIPKNHSDYEYEEVFSEEI